MTEHKKKTKPTDPEVANMEEIEELAAPEAGAEEMSIAELEKELAAVQDQCKEFSDGWQRERADFLNYRKRIEREQAQLHQVIAGNIIKKYLNVIDDMERALANRPPSAENEDWWAGVELIYRKLKGILEAEGVVEIPAEGQVFDPAVHEAITHEESDQVESGKVIAVVQKGYRLGDRIIRPALVRVAQ